MAKQVGEDLGSLFFVCGVIGFDIG
jgi:hypothetical protein